MFAFGETRGIKVRPRALITTMYARLVLSDLFIRGIGGAKYDELTDLIIRRFFGIEPPAYITATATFRLPIERPSVSLNDVQQSAQRLREREPGEVGRRLRARSLATIDVAPQAAPFQDGAALGQRVSAEDVRPPWHTRDMVTEHRVGLLEAPVT